MASVADAIEALTDPECLTMDGLRSRFVWRGVACISGTKATNRLRERGATDDAEALRLLRVALPVVGGEEIAGWVERPRFGPNRYSPTFEVPRDRLREQ